MTLWWLVPVLATAIAAVVAALAVRRLRLDVAGLGDDTAALTALGADAAGLHADVAALQSRLVAGGSPAPGDR